MYQLNAEQGEKTNENGTYKAKVKDFYVYHVNDTNSTAGL